MNVKFLTALENKSSGHEFMNKYFDESLDEKKVKKESVKK